MICTINELKNSGVFSDIDIHLADFLTGKAKSGGPELHLIILLLSSRLSQGDVCLDINAVAGRSLSDFVEGGDVIGTVVIPAADRIKSLLEQSGIAGGENDILPLILDARGRIYFQKYHMFERSLARSIKGMASPEPALKLTAAAAEMFSRLFPPDNRETDWQGVAALCALNSPFSVISGGPGTGKTTTVIRILALLIASMNGDASIALAAPTGKAAARLRESVEDSIGALDVSDEIKKHIPREAFTIHRLLGSVSGSPEFRHNRDNPLKHDIIVVDECSMADLALMSRFFSAVKPGARVILLGDRDQLSSVEGGAVFGDICDRGRKHGYTREFIKSAGEIIGERFISDTEVEISASPLSGAMTLLRKSHRFSGESGIGLLSNMIRAGDADAAVKLLLNDAVKDIVLTGECSPGAIEAAVRGGAAEFFGSSGLPRHEAVLEFIRGFAILTATRRGPAGSAALNLLVERVLEEAGVIKPSSVFYEGRPVMVTRNDYSLSLFNGDIGVTCFTGEGLRVMFERPDGERIYIHPSRMPEHETAFAITIHKSQGSEFRDVLVVLPPVEKRLMTRELLYTAVTRAWRRVIVASDSNTVSAMIKNPMVRMTGLRDRLWGTI